MARLTFVESINSYDDTKDCKFHTYLIGNIWRAFYDWTRDKTRWKRCNLLTDQNHRILKDENNHPIIIQDISLDAPVSPENEGVTLGETLYSDFDIEKEVSEALGFSNDEKVDKFLDKINRKQRDILKLLMKGYVPNEIKKRLGMTDKIYREQFAQILSFENIKEIRKLFPKANHYCKEEIEEDLIMAPTQTAEKSKPKQYSISSINKKIENHIIRFDHPLQRESDQWNPSMKGNLISDILQGNPLPEIVFAEQIINGIPVIWDLDGKQRCTNCYSFANDGFKVSKNIRRWNIKYIAQMKDEKGNHILDENHFPISEQKVFDIRNKKFSQLPEELQDRFLEYTFKCDQYLNCTSEDIAYHIIRYNEGKLMSKPQKGIMRLGEDYAIMVKSITAMPFFRDKGGYKVSELKNGTLERVVVESIMAGKYLEHWNSQQEILCEYLKNHAVPEDFEDFEDLVTKLDTVITDEVADMFNSKDSFLWFGLLAKFNDIESDIEKFVAFMAEFNRTLQCKRVDGVTYEELCFDKTKGKSRPTKDKSIVIAKMQLLEKLMLEFLGATNSLARL
ncbi:MAG: GmrSD restriction endonuclease domain-containing protein [Blautia sp.]